MILGTSWGHLGDILGIYWEYLGHILGISWEHADTDAEADPEPSSPDGDFLFSMAELISLSLFAHYSSKSDF